MRASHGVVAVGGDGVVPTPPTGCPRIMRLRMVDAFVGDATDRRLLARTTVGVPAGGPVSLARGEVHLAGRCAWAA